MGFSERGHISKSEAPNAIFDGEAQYCAKLQKEAAREVKTKELETAAPPLGKHTNNVALLSKKLTRKKLYKVQYQVKKYAMADKRVHACGMPLGATVDLCQHKEQNNFGYSGIMSCGSVWACPICRQKIVRKRAEKVTELSQNWKDQGGKISILTLTVSHTNRDQLADIIGKSANYSGISGALRRFRRSKRWRRFKDLFGVVGDIRVFEATWGAKNGWHPHFHLAIYHSENFDFQEQKEYLFKAWRDCCNAAGLRCNAAHGLDIRENKKDDYIVKWSVPNEVTGTEAKSGKNGNLTVAEIEESLLGEGRISAEKARKLLYQYYQTMKGRKMLVFGGLKGWVDQVSGELDKTDEELLQEGLEEFHENYEPKIQISKKAYHKIRNKGLLYVPLDIMEQTDSVQKLRDWLCDEGLGLPDDVLAYSEADP